MSNADKYKYINYLSITAIFICVIGLIFCAIAGSMFWMAFDGVMAGLNICILLSNRKRRLNDNDESY